MASSSDVFCSQSITTSDDKHQCTEKIFSLITQMTQPKTQSLDHITNLVFQGGGVKGVAYVGVLQRLQEIKRKGSPDFLGGVRRIAGTSAGSMVALYIGLNMSVGQIDTLMKQPYEDLLDDGLVLKVRVPIQVFGLNTPLNGERNWTTKDIVVEALKYFKSRIQRLEDHPNNPSVKEDVEKEMKDVLAKIMAYYGENLGVLENIAVKMKKSQYAKKAAKWLMDLLHPPVEAAKVEAKTSSLQVHAEKVESVKRTAVPRYYPRQEVIRERTTVTSDFNQSSYKTQSPYTLNTSSQLTPSVHAEAFSYVENHREIFIEKRAARQEGEILKRAAPVSFVSVSAKVDEYSIASTADTAESIFDDIINNICNEELSESEMLELMLAEESSKHANLISPRLPNYQTSYISSLDQKSSIPTHGGTGAYGSSYLSNIDQKNLTSEIRNPPGSYLNDQRVFPSEINGNHAGSYLSNDVSKRVAISGTPAYLLESDLKVSYKDGPYAQSLREQQISNSSVGINTSYAGSYLNYDVSQRATISETPNYRLESSSKISSEDGPFAQWLRGQKISNSSAEINGNNAGSYLDNDVSKRVTTISESPSYNLKTDFVPQKYSIRKNEEEMSYEDGPFAQWLREQQISNSSAEINGNNAGSYLDNDVSKRVTTISETPKHLLESDSKISCETNGSQQKISNALTPNYQIGTTIPYVYSHYTGGYTSTVNNLTYTPGKSYNYSTAGLTSSVDNLVKRLESTEPSYNKSGSIEIKFERSREVQAPLIKQEMKVQVPRLKNEVKEEVERKLRELEEEQMHVSQRKENAAKEYIKRKGAKIRYPTDSVKELTEARIPAALGEVLWFCICGQQNAAGIKEKLGLFTGSKIKEDLIEKPIKDRLEELERELKLVLQPKKDITFKELMDFNSRLPEEKKFKQIYVTAFNTVTSQTEVFSAEHTPNVVIADAVRASMSIPIFFTPVTIQEKNSWGGLENRSYWDDQGNKVPIEYMDGGIMDNYPLWIFDDLNYCFDEDLKLDSNRKYSIQNPNTLGFRLMDGETIRRYTDSNFKRKVLTQEEKESKESFAHQIKLLLNTVANEAQENEYLKRGDYTRSVYVNNNGISALAFTLKDPQRNGLIKSGKDSIDKYLSRVEDNFKHEGQAR